MRTGAPKRSWEVSNVLSHKSACPLAAWDLHKHDLTGHLPKSAQTQHPACTFWEHCIDLTLKRYIVSLGKELYCLHKSLCFFLKPLTRETAFVGIPLRTPSQLAGALFYCFKFFLAFLIFHPLLLCLLQLTYKFNLFPKAGCTSGC